MAQWMPGLDVECLASHTKLISVCWQREVPEANNCLLNLLQKSELLVSVHRTACYSQFIRENSVRWAGAVVIVWSGGRVLMSPLGECVCPMLV